MAGEWGFSDFLQRGELPLFLRPPLLRGREGGGTRARGGGGAGESLICISGCCWHLIDRLQASLSWLALHSLVRRNQLVQTSSKHPGRIPLPPYKHPQA
jgi:hypothetical protein